MSQLTKADLVAYCARLIDVPGTHIARILDRAMLRMRLALLDGMRVRLEGIGTVERVATQARKARNPRTREVIDVQPGHRIKFRASRDMRG